MISNNHFYFTFAAIIGLCLFLLVTYSQFIYIQEKENTQLQQFMMEILSNQYQIQLSEFRKQEKFQHEKEKENFKNLLELINKNNNLFSESNQQLLNKLIQDFKNEQQEQLLAISASLTSSENQLHDSNYNNDKIFLKSLSKSLRYWESKTGELLKFTIFKTTYEPTFFIALHDPTYDGIVPGMVIRGKFK